MKTRIFLLSFLTCFLLLLPLRWQRSSRRRRPQWRTTSDNHFLCWTCRSTPSRTPVRTALSLSLSVSISSRPSAPPSVSAALRFYSSIYLCTCSTLYFYPTVSSVTETHTHTQSESLRVRESATFARVHVFTCCQFSASRFLCGCPNFPCPWRHRLQTGKRHKATASEQNTEHQF